MDWRRVVQQKFTLSAFSTADIARPITEWIPAVGVDTIQATLKQYASTGGQNVRMKIAVQTATVRASAPGAWQAYDAYQTGNGEYVTAVVSVAAQLAGKQLFRLGVMYSVSVAGTGSSAAEVTATWAAVGEVLGSRALQVVTDSATATYEPLTKFTVALNAERVMLAAIASAASAGLEWRFAYQTAATSPENAAAAWTLLGAA